MHPTEDAPTIETTLWELLNTIYDVASSEEEAVAVIEAIIAEGRISLVFPVPACAA